MANIRDEAPGPGGAYFVTGGTGFIGRHLVQRLLGRPTGTIFVLVRERSLPRFRERLARWDGGSGRVVPIVGDLIVPHLGLTAEQIASLHGQVTHFFQASTSRRSTCRS